MADSRNYSMQRNYKYESHDKDGNFNGLTEDEWKNRIREEWTCDRLKANYVVFIFHDSDTDENGILKELHVHGCANFTEAIPLSNAIKLSGCSSDKNCKQIGRKKAQAYRYLLHITEKAIKDKKYIYGEERLECSVAKGETFDYKKIIQASETEENEKDDRKLLQRIIENIRQGVYGDGSIANGEAHKIYNNLLMDDDANRLMSIKPSNKRAIENAIEIKKETYVLMQRKNNEKNNKAQKKGDA